ncbi:VOC family protein [Rossellomorea aquimaris]|uniref:VOC family protein n=1 Tax=Rossellomorea aquimaris TaxID=189382 RepID=UPI0007D07392|nr:VOC family protein [Rossellomorea aquimaris]
MSYFQGVMQTNVMVSDMRRAKKWYSELLGLKVDKDYGTTVVFSFGSSESLGTICLIEKVNSHTDDDSTYPVLQISHPYKDVLYQTLKDNEVKVEENPSHPSHFIFYDCDGNKLEAYCSGIYEEN